MCARVSLCVGMCVFTRSCALFFFINRKGLPLYPVPIPAGPAHAHSFWRRPWSTFPPLFNRKQLFLVVFDEEKDGNFKTKEDKETSKSYLFFLITWLQALSWCMWQYRSFWSPWQSDNNGDTGWRTLLIFFLASSLRVEKCLLQIFLIFYWQSAANFCFNIHE